MAGPEPISDARFFISSAEKKNQFCRAVSFTETPLNEIHCLLEIEGRRVQLEPYGLVFLKEKLQKKGVAPVFYLNNELNDKGIVLQALCTWIENYPEHAKKIIPLISTFGAGLLSRGRIDFSWEREWRYPSVMGNLGFEPTDVFVGICPNDEIEYFEGRFPDINFVDCQRNMKWYANKLIQMRRTRNLKCSVV
jgi:hypothetical protein